MTDKTTEAVERLSQRLDALVHKHVGPSAPKIVRALAAERDALKAEKEPKSGTPDDDRHVLVAWRWPGGLGFSVGRYWWAEDSGEKVWVADDGEVMCADDEVAGWWELDGFRASLQKGRTDE